VATTPVALGGSEGGAACDAAAATTMTTTKEVDEVFIRHVEARVALLAAHSLLHLLGHDHEPPPYAKGAVTKALSKALSPEEAAAHAISEDDWAEGLLEDVLGGRHASGGRNKRAMKGVTKGATHGAMHGVMEEAGDKEDDHEDEWEGFDEEDEDEEEDYDRDEDEDGDGALPLTEAEAEARGEAMYQLMVGRKAAHALVTPCAFLLFCSSLLNSFQFC